MDKPFLLNESCCWHCNRCIVLWSCACVTLGPDTYPQGPLFFSSHLFLGHASSGHGVNLCLSMLKLIGLLTWAALHQHQAKKGSFVCSVMVGVGVVVGTWIHCLFLKPVESNNKSGSTNWAQGSPRASQVFCGNTSASAVIGQNYQFVDPQHILLPILLYIICSTSLVWALNLLLCYRGYLARHFPVWTIAMATEFVCMCLWKV